MRLNVSKNARYNKRFALWLLIKFRFLLHRSVDPRRLIVVADYINNNIVPITLHKLVSLIHNYIDSYQVVEDESSFVITADTTMQYQGISLHTLMLLVEHGSLNVPSYPLFSKVVSAFENNMKQLYKKYTLEGV